MKHFHIYSLKYSILNDAKKINEYTCISIHNMNVTYIVCFRILFPKTEMDSTLSTKSTSFLIVQ